MSNKKTVQWKRTENTYHAWSGLDLPEFNKAELRRERRNKFSGSFEKQTKRRFCRNESTWRLDWYLSKLPTLQDQNIGMWQEL